MPSRPVLLLAGEREDPRLLRGMERFHHQFRNSTLRLHEGARHGLPLAQPREFNESLRRVAPIDETGLIPAQAWERLQVSYLKVPD
ncbi:alpha/beta fold hydrolase [Arthrobacter sp. D3-16]